MRHRRIKGSVEHANRIIIVFSLVLFSLAWVALVFLVGLTLITQIKLFFLSSSTNSPVCFFLEIILKLVIFVKLVGLSLVPIFLVRLKLLPTLKSNSEVPTNCLKCSWFHGQIYGGNFLVCGMYPYGKEDCSDFSAR